MLGPRLLFIFGVACVAALTVAAEDAEPAFPVTRPATTPSATRPATAPAVDPVLMAKRRERLFDFLMGEYAGLLEKSKDRVGRSLIAICVARVPRPDATDRLLDMAQTEKDPLVRAVAWECVLARASLLSSAQHQKFVAMTPVLVRTDVLRGELRAAAARVLGSGAPDRAAKEAWNLMLTRAVASNSARDAATLDALCETLGGWQSPELMDFLMKKLAPATDAARVDALLRLAGSTAPGTAYAVHAKWWPTQRRKWVERKEVAEGSWKALAPHFVLAPPTVSSVDPEDKEWRRDLELRAPGLKNFDVGLCVDATGSMGPVLTWLKADVGKLMQGVGAVALEPRIGITFYRDHNDDFVAATKPLTHRVDELRALLSSMRAAGGGDRPEAVLEGLQDCYKSNRWTTAKEGKRIVILIGDAPPHPETQKQCEAAVAAAAERGFKLYAVQCAPDVPEFEALAAKGNGQALQVEMEELGGGVRRGGGRPAAAAAAAVAPAGRRLLSLILVDVINPQFKDRVEPMVDVLWEQLEDGAAGK
jgi:hypothetical protein